MKRYVAGFMFNPEGGMVALVRKKRPDWQSGLLNGVGGHIEAGELPMDAMRREFEEEAGVKHDVWVPLVRLYRPDVFEVFFYSAHTLNVYGVESKTDEPVSRYFVRELYRHKVVPSVNWLIPMALDRNIGRGDFIEIMDVRGN